MRHRRPLGFTLIELLVVIAIIGVLIALLLPAVQAAREGARRTQCINNMKQLGLAANNYADVSRVFPTVLPNEDEFTNPNSWMSMILPLIDQQQVYDGMNFGGFASTCATQNDYYIWSNKTAVRTLIGAFACPSDSTNTPQDYSTQLVQYRGGQQPTNYGGMLWAGRVWGAAPNNDASDPILQGRYQTPFFKGWISTLPGLHTNPIWTQFYMRHPQVKPGMVTDGLSRSGYALEIRAKVPGPRQGSGGEQPSTSVSSISYPLWYLNMSPAYVGYQNCDWADANSPWFFPPLASARFGINLPFDFTRQSPLDLQSPIYTAAGSYHPGGCNVVMGDGSVHFITNSIDQEQLRSYSSISGNETAAGLGGG